MRDSFKIVTKKSGLALVAAIAVFGVASPAFAQSYSFPTYTYLHPAAAPGSAPARRAGLYNAAANTPSAVDPNAWVSSAARGISR
jgi:hypothetical protein